MPEEIDRIYGDGSRDRFFKTLACDTPPYSRRCAAILMVSFLLAGCGLEHVQKQEPVIDKVVELERKKLIACMEKEAYNVYGYLFPSQHIKAELHKRQDSLYMLLGEGNRARTVLFDIEFHAVDKKKTRTVARVFRALFAPNENEDNVLKMLRACE